MILGYQTSGIEILVGTLLSGSVKWYSFGFICIGLMVLSKDTLKSHGKASVMWYSSQFVLSFEVNFAIETQKNKGDENHFHDQSESVHFYSFGYIIETLLKPKQWKLHKKWVKWP